MAAAAGRADVVRHLLGAFWPPPLSAGVAAAVAAPAGDVLVGEHGWGLQAVALADAALRACEYGHPGLAENIAAAGAGLGSAAGEAFWGAVRKGGPKVFAAACGAGHGAGARWLFVRGGLAAAARAEGTEEMRAAGANAFRLACGAGRLRLAQWLARELALTAEEVRAVDGWALREACGGGHLAIAQWLVGAFGLTADDARAAVRAARDRRAIGILRWLVPAFGLTRADVGEVPPRRASADPDFVLRAWLARALPSGADAGP